MAVSHIKNNTIADWSGVVTVGDSAGQLTTAQATDLVRPSDWNSVHNQFYTLSGNTTSASTASGTNVVFAASGPSIFIGGNTSTIIISSPPHVSSFHLPAAGSMATTSMSGATSHCQAFNLPEPGSFSFIRIPGNFTQASTSFATTAASFNASVQMTSTWNAVVYSWATGANSKVLTAVASGQGTALAMNSMSCAANGTQYSQTWAYTFMIEGNTFTVSTSTARSTSTINWSTGFQSDFSGGRFIDIPFANSLSAGPYYLVFGNSTSSSANSTQISAASQNFPKYTQHYHITQIDSAFGGMAGTAKNIPFNGGVFSTAGGGTTASIPHPNISSTASNPVYPFQMIRSA